MKLYELFDLNIKDPASKWIEPLKKSNKRNHSFEQILSHSAGWLPYIAHQNLIFNKKGGFKKNTLSKTKNKRFPASVSDSLYVHRRYEKKIFRRIKKTALSPMGEMVYSGMFYFFLPQLVEKMSGLSFPIFLETHIYDAMKLDRITCLPKSKFSKTEIVPTEQDSIFRKQLVHGWVHDEAASLMGGISGNAGLFSNANSIAPLLQMLLQNGRYQKKQFLKPETINLFTRRTYPKSDNPRGLGFDKPSLIFETKNRYPSSLVSPKTFGHTGYTGTMVWIDPENECFVILLTNRVYPSRKQRGLYELNIRPKLLDYAIQY
jgi:CubicO group peptidase (beta-lactamase class C family)